LYHSTLGSRVIKRRKKTLWDHAMRFRVQDRGLKRGFMGEDLGIWDQEF